MPTILQYEVDVYGAAGKKMEKDDIDRLQALSLHYEDNHQPPGIKPSRGSDNRTNTRGVTSIIQ